MKELLMGRLTYQGEKKLLMENQQVDDIINQLIKHHTEHAADYDKICMFFVRDSPRKTLQAIFDFLKKNVDYVVESEENQKLKTPGSIIYTGKTTGSDCKNYSLFTNGIVDALNRKGIVKIPFCYRFASYKLFQEQPQHVFAVAYPGTKNEIWIDPVLPTFDYRKKYTSKIDKKPMALYSVSGVGCYDCKDKTIGKTRAERKEKRKERQQKRRSGADCTGRTLMKFNPAAVAARKAFLFLVRLNIRGLGKKMYYGLNTPQTADKIYKKWCGFGGKASVLRDTVAKVERKLRSRGKITGGISLDSEGYIGVAIETVITTATPIILAMSKILNAGAKLLPEGSKAREILETGSDVASQAGEAGESFTNE